MTVKTVSFRGILIITQFLLTLPLYAFIYKAFSQINNDSVLKNRIDEESFILVNGIRQWVTVKGDRSKPVILFLHGGPGSPVSPYSDNLYRGFEKDFIIVQWDQRGTGRTFGLDAPGELTPEYLRSNPLTIEQMASDGIELSEHLVTHLGKQKLILFGSSWGSALGVKMATKRPDLYYAYIGHSQIVDPCNDLGLYNKVYEIAVKNNDKESLALLDAIGKPPYDRARDVGKLFRVVKKYERANSIAAPDGWFKEASAYDNAKDDKNRRDGDDYSFVNYVGDKQLGIQSIRSTINLVRDNLEFKIPVYLIQGSDDLLTPKEITKDYFDKLKAPKKEYFLLPGAAHGFNVIVLERQYSIFKSIETPQ